MRALEEYEDDVIELGREVLAGESATGYDDYDAYWNLFEDHNKELSHACDQMLTGYFVTMKSLLLRSACELVESYYLENDV